MPSLSYGIGAFDRDTGSLPELKCVNLFAESAKTSENQICLQSRPGLVTAHSAGAGPIDAIYSERGVFSGDVFTVSAGNIYRTASSLGTVAGSGVPSFAGTATELLCARGGALRRYNGTTLNNPTFPDSASVRAVCVINFLFVAIRGDGTYPGRFYWSDVNNGNSWDALDYATAERVPDDLLDIAAHNDILWLFGQSSIEPWQPTGDAAAPFKRIPGVAFPMGVMATGCVTKADNSLFFIGSDAVVYRATDGSPQRVSDHWLEEKLKASASHRAYSFKHHGHEFVCVRTATQTFAYDPSTQQWCEFQTNGGQFIGNCAAMAGTTAYIGHSSTGAVMNPSGWQDLGVAIDRIFTAATILDRPLTVDNVRLWVNAGNPGVTPTLSMRQSTDAGNTWTAYRTTDIGSAALDGNDDYRVRPEYRRCGLFDDPGAMFEFKFSANSDFRVSAVKINEPGGGRSRA